MVAAVRGAPMKIEGDYVYFQSLEDDFLEEIVKAFGLRDEGYYLDTLEREGRRILRRMRW